MMIGEKFPQLKMRALMPNGSIQDDLSVGGQTDGYTVVFFYPKDFTFVCPTEILEFNSELGEFSARGVTVMGCSVDTAESHQKWSQTPLKDGGIEKLDYALLADDHRELSQKLGILNADGLTYRASYLLDKNGVIRHMVVNDMPLGRSVSEMLRMVDALATYEEIGEVCPANWQKGKATMKANTESTAAYLSKTYAN